ncbi:MAG: L-histidine N(alpha)-methyltransferase [Gemmatimonadota bacterium]
MIPLARLAEPPRLDSLREEVLAGLGGTPKTLPARLLYDAGGSRLFDRITTLPEYYLTRTELEILRRCLGELAELVGPDALVVEPGSGNGAKAQMLLGALVRPRAYVPVDVAVSQLRSLARTLRDQPMEVEIHPVVADYTRPFELPLAPAAFRRTLVFFPGSTIGNFALEEAVAFLAMLGRLAGPEGALLLGADLRKSPRILEPAYNDSAGLTAAFNRNVLLHLNRALGTHFDPLAFRHHAPWVPDESRIEMRLVSVRHQVVRVPVGAGERPAEVRVELEPEEPIVTEHSYKYWPEDLERLVGRAGWTTVREWRDEAGWYSVRFLERSAAE